jgi:hypothetical protein
MKRVVFFLFALAICGPASAADAVLLTVDLDKSIMEDRYFIVDPKEQAGFEAELSKSAVAAIATDGRWSKYIWKLEPAAAGAKLTKKDHLLVAVAMRDDGRNFEFKLTFTNRAGLVEDLGGASILGEQDLQTIGAPMEQLGEKIGKALSKHCFATDKLHQNLCQHVVVGSGRVGISPMDDTGAIYLPFDEYERFSHSLFQFKCAKGGKLLTTKSCGTGLPVSTMVLGKSLVCLAAKHAAVPMGMVADDEAEILMIEFHATPTAACGAPAAGAPAAIMPF